MTSADTIREPSPALRRPARPQPARPAHRSRRRALLTLLEYGTPILLLAFWWFAGAMGLTSFYFPSLQTIVERFPEVWTSEVFVEDVVPTLTAILGGYLASCVLGVVAGTALGLSPRLNEFLTPLLEFFRAMPAVAAVPIFIILLGVGMEMKIVCIVFAAIWPVLLNTVDGVSGIDATMRDTARSYHLDSWTRITRLVLPAASPSIVAGMRIALAQSMVLIIISEMVASSAGIGNVVSTASGRFDLVAVWTGIVLMAVVAFVLSKLFQLFEHTVLAWHRGLHGRETV
jgi:ABC-type nitrate/sulfonate/bicarbonate transport system permease component